MTRNNVQSSRRAGILALTFCLGISLPGWGQADTPQGVAPTDAAQAQPPDAAQSQAAPPSQAVMRPPTITIGPGDQIEVAVFDTPELSGPARVSQTGEVNLPVLGNVQVGGLTPNQAARKIEEALKSRGILIDPHVTVSIAEYASQGATVTGEVHAPGVYPTLGSRRLLDMIALAGGVSTSAGRTATIVHRNDPQHPVNIELVPNNNALGAQENPVILPGDTVVIAKAGIIYILGDVGRAGGYLIDNNDHLSLLQALSLAGGWTKTSAQSKVILIRKIPDGREEIKLDLSHMVHGQLADIAVSNGDILFIPSSVGKMIAYQGVSAAIQGAEQAVVYGAIYH
ncbi:MAG: polysaccharide biosynthesis/export family protein [Silvibacterium sp.]|nr:polysaccharide biosynthesis/export family protein [Silvibacterium sp.]